MSLQPHPPTQSAGPGPFEPSFDRLPGTLAIFPLAGVVLLPRGRLPLNVFEPRYVALVEDALATPGRLIGMIQPTGTVAEGEEPPLYRIGCAGRISSFGETDDGRYLISLSGVCRFALGAELDGRRGYRRVTPDWAPFRDDLGPEEPPGLDRARLLTALRQYFDVHGITVNWEAIEGTPDARLIDALAMLCPFEEAEKQILLEAPTLADRARLLLAIVEMSAFAQPAGDGAPRH